MKVALLDIETQGHHLKYAGELADYLHKKGDEVMFFTLEKDERVDQFAKDRPFITLNIIYPEGCDKNKKPFFVRRCLDIWETYKAFSEAEKWGTDVFHFLYFDSFYVIYLLSFKKWKFKIFGSSLWLLNNIGNLAGNKFYLRAVKQVNQILLKNLLKRGIIRKIFVQNIFPKNYKIEAFKQIIWLERFQDKFLFLHDPIYDDFSNICSKEQAVKKLNLPQDIPILLFFGVLCAGKGIDILFDSLHKVKNKVCLIMAGPPDYFTQKDIDEFKRKIGDKHIVVDRVYFIPEKDIPYYFIGSDCVVMPYGAGYALGSSGVLMQSCSARKPVICSDIGILGRVVEENFLGLLVQSGSPESLAQGIETFLNHKEEITEKVQLSGQDYLKNGSWDRVAGIIYESYAT